MKFNYIRKQECRANFNMHPHLSSKGIKLKLPFKGDLFLKTPDFIKFWFATLERENS